MLKKKMLRDIRRNASQFVTIFLMVMIGVTVYVGIEAYMDGMTNAADKFYEENNLQDLDVYGISFTNEDLEQVKSIDNVSNAELKLTITGSSNGDTLLLNFIDSNEISKFYVLDGEEFDAGNSGVWLDNYYAIENDISVGDTITITYNDIVLEEVVRGLINVPDHVYDVEDESELVPNREEFGFAYLSSKELGSNVTYNYIMVDVDDTTKTDEVKEEIEEELSVLAVLNIEDTTSYKTYQGEIDEGKTYVGVFSGLFIFIAFLSVITTMMRVIKKERIEIGTLKALGFSNNKILIHYMSYGLIIALPAALLGILLGYIFIGKLFMDLEMSLFEVPNGLPLITAKSFIMAFLVVLGVLLIIFLTGRKILSVSPADSLKPEVPTVKKNQLNITKGKAFNKLGFTTKWNIRDILRNKLRTIMSIVGVTCSCALIVCAFGMLDSINFFTKLQFEMLYNFEYKLNISSDTSLEDIKELLNTYGTNTSKTYSIEVTLNNEEVTNNIFVDDANDYVRFVNQDNEYIKITDNTGIYVTSKLAEVYNLSIGDTLTWHIYGSNTTYESVIVGFNKDPQNQNITMSREYLESLGITYIPDTIYTNEDLSDISSITGVDTIQNKDTLKTSMEGMLSRMESMIFLIVFIAIILGSLIIYNLGILSSTEKSYQFATLKVLGFSDKQISKIFIKQNMWLVVISIIIGLPSGFYLTDWLFKTAIEDSYDFAASINVTTYLIAAIGSFLVSYLVSKFLTRKIKNIDMVSSLKQNE